MPKREKINPIIAAIHKESPRDKAAIVSITPAEDNQTAELVAQVRISFAAACARVGHTATVYGDVDGQAVAMKATITSTFKRGGKVFQRLTLQYPRIITEKS